MYTTPSGNPINNYTYRDFQHLYPIYIGFQDLYYNHYQPLPITQRINDPSNKGPIRDTLYGPGIYENYDHLNNPVTQNNPNKMVYYCKPFYSMKEPTDDEPRQISYAEYGKKTSNVSVHGYNIY